MPSVTIRRVSFRIIPLKGIVAANSTPLLSNHRSFPYCKITKTSPDTHPPTTKQAVKDPGKKEASTYSLKTVPRIQKLEQRGVVGPRFALVEERRGEVVSIQRKVNVEEESHAGYKQQ